MKVKSESEVAQSCPTSVTPWIAAFQAPPSIRFSRQEYWSGVPHAYPPTNLPMGFDKHNEETDIHFFCVPITIPRVSITAK